MFDRREKKSDTSGTEVRGKRGGTVVSGEKRRDVIKLGRLQLLSSVDKDQEID